MMVDNYLLHTLENQFEQQEEDQYKKQMLSHYSEQGSVVQWKMCVKWTLLSSILNV